jgi:FkbM family methyltransferase
VNIRVLLKEFLTRINHSHGLLPYNVNWGVKTKSLRGFLSKYPLSVIDIGARYGPTTELTGLLEFIRYVGFDSDEEECRRLMADPPGHCLEFQIYPHFIGKPGTVNFHLYEAGGLRGLSSNYELNDEFVRTFGVFTGREPRLERTVALKAVGLDDVMTQKHLAPPDILKLDTQGSELEILQTANRTLAQTPLVEVEAEFFPVYKGQPFFADVDILLRSSGFELLYLDRHFRQRRKIYKGLSRGQLISGDALYGKSPSQIRHWSPERIAKYIILLCHYGHIDLAHQILSEHSGLLELCPGIVHLFPKEPSMVRRGLISQLDKLTCFLLYMRRTNHVYGGSDRSFPTR